MRTNVIRSINWFLIFTILLFIAVYGVNHITTALNRSIFVGWTIVGVFLKSYMGVVLLYYCFKISTVAFPDITFDRVALNNSFRIVLRILQRIFLVAITIQVSSHLLKLWYTLKLYPLELGIWESIWTLIRYCIGLLGTWVLEFWFWIGKQLRISFLLNNPCFGGICLEEYPWVSLLLSAMLAYVFKQLWSISFIRGIIHFSFRLFYGAIRMIAKFLLQKISAKAASHISSSLLITVGKETMRDIQDIYLLPAKEVSQKTIE